MDPKIFGALALQLLSQSSIPGGALDQALEFRRLALALAEGGATLIAVAEGENKHPSDQGL